MGLGKGTRNRRVTMSNPFTQPDELDWSSIATWSELKSAIQERVDAVRALQGPDAIYEFNPALDDGTDVQSVNYIKSYQAAVGFTYVWKEWVLPGYWVEHISGTGLLAYYSESLDETDLSKRTISEHTIRRTKVHPDDPAFTGFESGACEAGDIIGPWIFEDLQTALSKCKYLIGAIKVATATIAEGYYIEYGHNDSDYLIEKAKADADTNAITESNILLSDLPFGGPGVGVLASDDYDEGGAFEYAEALRYSIEDMQPYWYPDFAIPSTAATYSMAIIGIESACVYSWYVGLLKNTEYTANPELSTGQNIICLNADIGDTYSVYVDWPTTPTTFYLARGFSSTGFVVVGFDFTRANPLA